jgi:multidrug efflux pump subunit AcrA (membrane-fusion protein)
MSGENTSPNLAGQTVAETLLDSSSPPQNANGPSAPKSPRRFLVPGLLLLAVLGGAGWLVYQRVIAPILMFSQMKPQPTAVKLGAPKQAAIADSSDYAAVLDSRQSVNLQPQVSGQVSAIYVKAGDRVEAGQPLLQIDATEQRAQVASRTAAAETSAAEVESARADVANAQATLKSLEARRLSAQADVKFAQGEYQRYQQLVSEGAASQQLVEQKLNALQTAKAAAQETEADMGAQTAAISRNQAIVARSQRAVEQAQANIAEGQAQLRYYTIKAPQAGIIGDIPTKIGDYVTNAGGSPTPLLTITQNQELEVNIQVPLERAPALRKGLMVKLLGDGDKVLQTGRISFIAPNVDPTTQSVQVKAVFNNARTKLGGPLRTAQFVRAQIVWATRSRVMVPTSAISRLGGKDFIFVAIPFQASDCKVALSGGGPPFKPEPTALVSVQKPLQLGKIVNSDQEVLEGLTTGDRIVTSGILQLQNCMAIADR